jgi:hypothetical protein
MLFDYKLFVLTKASPSRDLDESVFHLSHACFGLATEYLELIISSDRANTEEELGDFCWYMLLAGHAVDYDLSTLPLELPSKERPTLTIRRMCEMLETFISLAKKHIIYGNDQTGLLKQAYYGLWISFIYHLQACDYPLELCIKENMDKLNQRYKDTFTQEEAAERRDKQ